MSRIRHALAPLPADFARKAAAVAEAQSRRLARDCPPPDHIVLGEAVAAQLGYHGGGIRQFFRQAELHALAIARRKSGQ